VDSSLGETTHTYSILPLPMQSGVPIQKQ